MAPTLDEVDRGILFALQRDARNTTIAEIAEEVDASSTTVRNRIAQLEDDGVIEGYYPKINYERAQFPLRVLFVCSAPGRKRPDLAIDALRSRGVTDVREMLTTERNLYVEVVATDTADLTDISNDLADLGFAIVSSEIVSSHHVRPWAHFEYDQLREPIR